MNYLFRDDVIDAPNGDIPTTIPSLIDAAVAAFDADRDTSRRYLLRASALLRVKRGVCADADSARPSETRGGLLAWQLNRVTDYIEAHLADKITAMNLADLINVSVGRLSRAFKISVGVPPFHYIGRRRVKLACTMMSTTREPLSQIAIACGLCDQAHLCKVFRRMIGRSPSAWRRTMPARDAVKSGIIEVRDFAGDVEPSKERALYAVQGRGADALPTTKTTTAAWRLKPTWYPVSTEDRTINPELERSRPSA
jgi:AraC family transcriptional regulator